jgi:hypothetical protein
MKKWIFAGVVILGLLVAGGAYCGLSGKIIPQSEGVFKVEPTDGGLHDLDVLCGQPIGGLFRNTPIAQMDLIHVKVLRSRFVRVEGTRYSELRFSDIFAVPIETRMTERPRIVTILKGGSTIFGPRFMRAEDVKVVVMKIGNVVKFIELI